jgi:hypothetical protein
MSHISKSILQEVLLGRCKNGLLFYLTEKRLNHLDAIQYCVNLRHNDLVGWRLPTYDELGGFLRFDSSIQILSMISDYWTSNNWEASTTILDRKISVFNKNVKKNIIAVNDISRFKEVI